MDKNTQSLFKTTDTHGYVKRSEISFRAAKSVVGPLGAGYVPDGMTAEQYKALKEKEKPSYKKNLGRVGPKGF